MQESRHNDESTHMSKVGKNFLGILNDLKRRPEDAAKELGIPLEQIQAIIDGKKLLSSEIILLHIKFVLSNKAID